MATLVLPLHFPTPWPETANRTGFPPYCLNSTVTAIQATHAEQCVGDSSVYDESICNCMKTFAASMLTCVTPAEYATMQAHISDQAVCKDNSGSIPVWLFWALVVTIALCAIVAIGLIWRCLAKKRKIKRGLQSGRRSERDEYRDQEAYPAPSHETLDPYHGQPANEAESVTQFAQQPTGFPASPPPPQELQQRPQLGGLAPPLLQPMPTTAYTPAPQVSPQYNYSPVATTAPPSYGQSFSYQRPAPPTYATSFAPTQQAPVQGFPGQMKFQQAPTYGAPVATATYSAPYSVQAPAAGAVMQEAAAPQYYANPQQVQVRPF